MNLRSINTAGHSTLTVRHPGTNLPLQSEDGRQVKITLRSADSKEYQGALHIAQRETARNSATSGGEPDPALLEESTTGVIVACFVNWENVEWDDQPMDPTPENFRKIILEHRWLREQCNLFIQQRSNFLVGDAGKLKQR